MLFEGVADGFVDAGFDAVCEFADEGGGGVLVLGVGSYAGCSC